MCKQIKWGLDSSYVQGLFTLQTPATCFLQLTPKITFGAEIFFKRPFRAEILRKKLFQAELSWDCINPVYKSTLHGGEDGKSMFPWSTFRVYSFR